MLQERAARCIVARLPPINPQQSRLFQCGFHPHIPFPALAEPEEGIAEREVWTAGRPPVGPCDARREAAAAARYATAHTRIEHRCTGGDGHEHLRRTASRRDEHHDQCFYRQAGHCEVIGEYRSSGVQEFRHYFKDAGSLAQSAADSQGCSAWQYEAAPPGGCQCQTAVGFRYQRIRNHRQSRPSRPPESRPQPRCKGPRHRLHLADGAA